MLTRLARLSLSSIGLLALIARPATAQEHQHDQGVGTVEFPTACNAEAQRAINTAVAMLHSFWFVEARNTFRAAADADPACGTAYWGIAITHFGNPFAGGPGPEGNRAGLTAAQRAVAIGGRAPRDQAYIAAALSLYADHDRVDNRTRMRAYEAALGDLHAKNPADSETAILHALWMVANASPLDSTFAQQRKAADILNPLFERQPDHPGLAHYIIHAFDSPPLAHLALGAARRYAEIAPAAPHALHMPSHTFTRLGHWDESIQTNRRSMDLEPPGSKGHAADYMVYAFLQQGRDDAARAVMGEIGLDPSTEDPTGVVGRLAGYNSVAMQARFALERNDWALASTLSVPIGQPPSVEAVTRFARALGAARAGNAATSRAELEAMHGLVTRMTDARDPYWPIVVDAQRLAAEAWVLHLEGRHADALRVAAEAAAKEDLVEKHPVTPGPLIPARELLGDILLVHGRPADALAAYEQTLRKEPNRFRALHGAAKAARAAGRDDAAARYYRELLDLGARESARAELVEARAFLGAR
ncbi:MAG: hypothetical protein WD771_11560 [Gemmatimonadaceae bacterium]